MRTAWWFLIGYVLAGGALRLVRWRLYRGAKQLTRREIYLADPRRGRIVLGYVILGNIVGVVACVGYFVVGLMRYDNWGAIVHTAGLALGSAWLLATLLGYGFDLQVVGWWHPRYVMVAPRSLASRIQVAYAAVFTAVPAVLLALELRG